MLWIGIINNYSSVYFMHVFRTIVIKNLFYTQNSRMLICMQDANILVYLENTYWEEHAGKPLE
jgi:hypothetical protein